MLYGSTQRKLEKTMQSAESYDIWKGAAQEHDERSGLNHWKRMDQSRRYDYVSIRTRLDRLRSLRARNDNIGLLFTLNEGIHGNVGGMGRPSLYAKTKFGTKQLITDYVDEIASALDHIASPAVDEIHVDDKLDFFRRASHCYGRSALMLSGAGSLGFFHIGVVSALLDEGLLPEVLSGASAGALMCAMIGTRSKSDFKQLVDSAQFYAKIIRALSPHTGSGRRVRLHADNIQDMIEAIIPDMTFQEAFELSGRSINISVAPSETHQTSRLLNAITSPNVYIREAVMASTALPGVFPAVTLAAKNVHGDRQPYLPSRKWVDGSVSDDLPAKRLARLYGVNHYIASQTNPLVLPFVSDAKVNQGVASLLLRTGQNVAKECVGTGFKLLHKSLDGWPRIRGLTDMLGSLVSQQYTGDINIFPSSRLYNPLTLLTFRSEKEIKTMIEAGRRSTWPKIEMIRVQTKISRVLDRILYDYEGLISNHPVESQNQEQAKVERV